MSFFLETSILEPFFRVKKKVSKGGFKKVKTKTTIINKVVNRFFEISEAACLSHFLILSVSKGGFNRYQKVVFTVSKGGFYGIKRWFLNLKNRIGMRLPRIPNRSNSLNSAYLNRETLLFSREKDGYFL